MSNVIHIKLDYEEALNAKKDMLYTEQNLIKLTRIIQKYKTLRSAELKSKIKLHKQLKETLRNIKMLEETLPRIEIPNILQHGKQAAMQKLVPQIVIANPETQKDRSLERQLEEIQRKLKALEK